MSDENPKPSELYEEKEENRYQRKGSPQISLNKFEALKSRKAKVESAYGGLFKQVLRLRASHFAQDDNGRRVGGASL